LAMALLLSNFQALELKSRAAAELPCVSVVLEF